MQQQEEREKRQSEGDERKFAFVREEEGRLLELEVKAQNIIKEPPENRGWWGEPGSGVEPGASLA